MGKTTSVSQDVMKQVDAAEKNGSKTITVIQKTVKITALSIREKERIEKLVDKRQGTILEYLTEMREFAEEANTHMPNTSEDAISELATQTAQLDMKIERQDATRQAEYHAVDTYLKEELNRKLERLERMKDRIKGRHRDESRLARDTVDEKFAKKLSTLAEERTAFQKEQIKLTKSEEGVKMARRMTLVNSFNTLRDQVKDARNHAVESLWTAATLPEHATTILEALPDTRHFRNQVTPEHLFGIFDATVKQQGIENSALCSGCGSANINPHGQTYYCRECGVRDSFPESLTKGTALPDFDDIMKSVTISKPLLCIESAAPMDNGPVVEGKVAPVA